MTGKTIGFAVTGSFCTFSQIIPVMESLARNNRVIPVLSDMAYRTDTRFYQAEDFREAVRRACGNEIIHTIVEAEPVGPKKLFDIMVVAPCTGNTLAKLAHGVTDTAVTMAAKAHLRNGRPLVLALASNDALAGGAPNLGVMLSRRNIYFVPLGQDDCAGKPASLVADFTLLPETIEAACRGAQLQPVLLGPEAQRGG